MAKEINTFADVMASDHAAVRAYKLHMRSARTELTVASWTHFRAGWDALQMLTMNAMKQQLESLNKDQY